MVGVARGAHSRRSCDVGRRNAEGILGSGRVLVPPGELPGRSIRGPLQRRALVCRLLELRQHLQRADFLELGLQILGNPSKVDAEVRTEPPGREFLVRLMPTPRRLWAILL